MVARTNGSYSNTGVCMGTLLSGKPIMSETRLTICSQLIVVWHSLWCVSCSRSPMQVLHCDNMCHSCARLISPFYSVWVFMLGLILLLWGDSTRYKIHIFHAAEPLGLGSSKVGMLKTESSSPYTDGASKASRVPTVLQGPL